MEYRSKTITNKMTTKTIRPRLVAKRARKESSPSSQHPPPVAIYICGLIRGSSAVGEGIEDQQEAIDRYLHDKRWTATITFTDDRPRVRPFARQGMQALIRWLESESTKRAVVLVAHSRYFFAHDEAACGDLTWHLRSEVHFVQNKKIATTDSDARRAVMQDLVNSTLE